MVVSGQQSVVRSRTEINLATLWLAEYEATLATIKTKLGNSLKLLRLDAVRGLFEARSEAVRQVLRASTAKYNEVMRQEANWHGRLRRTTELAGGRF